MRDEVPVQELDERWRPRLFLFLLCLGMGDFFVSMPRCVEHDIEIL